MQNVKCDWKNSAVFKKKSVQRNVFVKRIFLSSNRRYRNIHIYRKRRFNLLKGKHFGSDSKIFLLAIDITW